MQTVMFAFACLLGVVVLHRRVVQISLEISVLSMILQLLG